MKKFFAILLALVLVVGAVFAATNNSTAAQVADGNAVIKVTAVIDEAVPAFQLSTTDTTNVKTAVSDNVDNDTDATTNLTDDNEALLSASDSNSVTVAFAINQIAPANLKAAYEITVEATDLLLVKYSDGTDFSGTQSDIQKFVCNDTTPAVSGSSVTISSVEAITISGTDNKLSVGYTGNIKVPASTSAVQALGSFNVRWNGNANAVAGTYSADVTMIVTSV